MATKPYRPIDVHAATAPAWPTVIPKMTHPEAVRAFKRLYRWGTGRTFAGVIIETTGNRRPVRLGWEGGKRATYVNASHGWKDFVHYLSHWLDIEVNGSSKHGKHHARFEARMIREVVKRDYLDGALRDAPKPTRVPNVVDRDAARLKRIDELTKAWRTKHTRAENALEKLLKERNRIERKMAREQVVATMKPGGRWQNIT